MIAETLAYREPFGDLPHSYVQTKSSEGPLLAEAVSGHANSRPGRALLLSGGVEHVISSPLHSHRY